MRDTGQLYSWVSQAAIVCVSADARPVFIDKRTGTQRALVMIHI